MILCSFCAPLNDFPVGDFFLTLIGGQRRPIIIIITVAAYERHQTATVLCKQLAQNDRIGVVHVEGALRLKYLKTKVCWRNVRII